MISSGQNPAKYVDALVAAQQEDGSFKLGSVEQTEWAVIAPLTWLEPNMMRKAQ